MISFRTLKPSEIECRIGTCSEKGVSLLLYKDARCDMTLLDEAVGPENWMRSHSRDNRNCTISIWCADKGQWVSKEDTGTESNTEAEKGLASDSFKRAAVNWGIGRELYTAPFIWIGADSCRIQQGRNGKPTCYDCFKVKTIRYNDDREIVALEIMNGKTGAPVFTFGKKEEPKQAPAPEPAPAPANNTPRLLMCQGCSAKFEPKYKNGRPMDPKKYLDLSREKFNGTYCPACAAKLKK